MTFEEWTERLQTLSREDLLAVCAQKARSLDAVLQRSAYWMRRCDLAETELAKRWEKTET
jgi:hypothetical protein